MRSRRKERTTFLSLLGASVAAALFLPALPRVQSVAGAAFAPVSHPAKAIGGAVINLVSSDKAANEGVDPEELDAPALRDEVARLRLQIDATRTVLLSLTEQLEALKRLNVDRAKLGSSLRQRSEPLTIVGLIEGEGDLLQAVGSEEATTEGRIALHTGGPDGGFAGTVEAGALGAGSPRYRPRSSPCRRRVAPVRREDAGGRRGAAGALPRQRPRRGPVRDQPAQDGRSDG